jgi:hypothetical protein
VNRRRGEEKSGMMEYWNNGILEGQEAGIDGEIGGSGDGGKRKTASRKQKAVRRK